MKIRSQIPNRLRFESLQPRATMAADAGRVTALGGTGNGSVTGYDTWRSTSANLPLGPPKASLYVHPYRNLLRLRSSRSA